MIFYIRKYLAFYLNPFVKWLLNSFIWENGIYVRETSTLVFLPKKVNLEIIVFQAQAKSHLHLRSTECNPPPCRFAWTGRGYK